MKKARIILALTCAAFVFDGFLLFAEKKPQFSKELQSDPTFKEAREFAKDKRDHAFEVLRTFSNGAHNELKPSCDDFLPSEDKGKAFDSDSAHQKASNARESGAVDIPDEERKLHLGLERSSLKHKRNEGLDGSESFWGQSEVIMENPKGEIGILVEDIDYAPEEENLRTCQDGSDYQSFINLNRNIKIIPEKRKKIRTCKGHKEQKGFSKKQDAQKYETQQKEKLSKDRSIKDFHVSLGKVLFGFIVEEKYFHKNNAKSCSNYDPEEKIVSKRIDQETWDPDQADTFSSILGNPNCTLIAEQVVKGPETKIIDGVPYYRDVWEKKLMFSCTECDNSGCQEIRKQGGRLIKKKCLKELETGECVLWEKVYDLGGRAANNQTKFVFDGEEIFGLEGWDSSYEKNNEIGETLATFSSFADIKHEIENSPEGIFNEKSVEIFKGENHRCQCTFLDGVFFDCCKKMRGLTLDVGIARCSQEEKLLAEKRKEGKCHFVGSKAMEILGTNISKNQCYCCFSTKLARIINEEGRKQLGLDWGTFDKPDCTGFSIQRLQRLDFNKMDLSEVIEDFENKIKKDDLTNKLQNIAGQYNAPSAGEEIKNKTHQLLEEHKNLIKMREDNFEN